MRHFVFLIAIFASLIPELRAGEPFFKPNDIVALVGGEDMVVAAELGYLETLIQLALPDHHLKFRSLAREGDTVFEQRRDLNYPSLEAQLDKMGATVVICQFGQMESLAGEEKIPAFIAAYEKLILRVAGGGKRRVVVHRPDDFELYLRPLPSGDAQNRLKELEAIGKSFEAYAEALSNLKEYEGPPNVVYVISGEPVTRDSIHPNDLGHWLEAKRLANVLENGDQTSVAFRTKRNGVPNELLNLIRAKNRLWFHYYRPQNWAFLAGDRTNQPSSRDHLDPSKRWFPEELEKFVPLIDAKDAEIWALAKKLSAEGGK